MITGVRILREESDAVITGVRILLAGLDAMIMGVRILREESDAKGAMHHCKPLPNLYTTYYLFLLLLMVQR